MALANSSIYYTWKINSKSLLQLGMMILICLAGSYSVSEIQDYFEYIITKHETIANNPPVQIYVNKIKNNIVFKIKTCDQLEWLPLETIEVSRSTKKDVDQDKDREDVPKLEPV